MKYRVILLIHESSLIRKSLSGYIRSELNDVKIIEAKHKYEVELILNTQNIDVILSGHRMNSFDSTFVLSKIRSSSHNSNTPLIVLSASQSKSNVEELRDLGIQHYIFPPHSSCDLISKINALYDPRKLRSEPRYFIPGATAVIHMENCDLKTKVINLSQKAVRCELKLNELKDTLLKANYISLYFPEEYQNITIENIWSKVLNINVLNWNKDLTAKTFQATWLFQDFGGSQNTLTEIFDQIRVNMRTHSI